jgi:hypothetical protein
MRKLSLSKLETKALPPLPPDEPSPASPRLSINEKRLSSQSIPIIVQPAPSLSTPIRQEHEQNYARLQELYEQEKQKVKSLENITEQYSQLQVQYKEIKEKVQELCLENEVYRGQIFELQNSRCDPRQGEEYYIHTFEELKGLTEKELVKLSRSNGDISLSGHEKEEILKCLERMGDHGKRSAEYLRGEHDLEKLYSMGRWRHPLIRHIVGIYLLDLVFKPYAFGLSREISNGMKFVERDILLHGLNSLDTNLI